MTGRLYMVDALSNHGERLRWLLTKVLGKDHAVMSVSDTNAALLEKDIVILSFDFTVIFIK